MLSVRLRKSLTLVVVLLVLSACLADVTPPTSSPTATQTAYPTSTSVPSPTVLPIPVTRTTTPVVAPNQPSDADALAWLQQNAISLQTSKPGHGFDDLLRLEPLVHPARVVGLGESTYGAREFVQMNYRLVTFLIQQEGFNVVAVDLNTTEANQINSFIQGGSIPQSFDPSNIGDWRSQEAFYLLAWMRNFNLHHADADRLRFVGIGIRPPWFAIQAIENYLQKVDLAAYQMAVANYACLTQFESGPSVYGQQPLTTQIECRDQLQIVYAAVQNKREEYSSKSSEAQFQDAVASTNEVLQAEEVLSGGERVRNQLMADNVSKLLATSGPNAKVIILAHNDFVGVRSGPIQTMGAYLRSQHGARYVTIGLDFYQGTLSLCQPSYRPLAPNEAPTPPGDSYEQFFQLAQLPFMLVLLGKPSPGTALPAWLAQPHAFRSMGEPSGACAGDQNFYPARLPEEFDAIIYLQDICPTTTGDNVYFRPTNVDFEYRCSPDWQLISTDPLAYESDYDTRVAHSGRTSLYLQSLKSAPAGNGWVEQSIQPGNYLGTRVRFSAYLRTDNVAGSAGLLISTDETEFQTWPSAPAAAIQVDGTREWQRYSMELDLPRVTTTLYYGVVLSGTGKLWLDDVQLEIVAMATPTPSRPSLLATPTSLPTSALREQDVAGQGAITAGGIDLVEGLAIFHISSDGSGPFSVSLGTYGEQAVERIVDTTGPFSGGAAVHIPAAGRYLLNVQATGEWRIRLEQPDVNGGVRYGSLPQTFTGQGKQVSPPFFLKYALANFHLVYDGAGPFKVNLLDKDGLIALIVADFGGSVGGHMDDVFGSAPPSGAGNYVLDINAGGAYTITVAQ
jgi:erythromycin esterase